MAAMEQKPIQPKEGMGAGAGSAAGAKTGGAGPKWSQWVWVLIALLVIGGFVYFLGKQEAKAPEESMEEEVMEGETDRTHAGPSLMWEFNPAGGNQLSGAPDVQVMLVVDGETHDLGTYPGSCMIVDGSGAWLLQEGEVTGVICWWNKKGTELGVFYQNGRYVVKKGAIEEGSGTVPSMRGNYEEMFTI